MHTITRTTGEYNMRNRSKAHGKCSLVKLCYDNILIMKKTEEDACRIRRNDIKGIRYRRGQLIIYIVIVSIKHRMH